MIKRVRQAVVMGLNPDVHADFRGFQVTFISLSGFMDSL